MNLWDVAGLDEWVSVGLDGCCEDAYLGNCRGSIFGRYIVGYLGSRKRMTLVRHDEVQIVNEKIKKNISTDLELKAIALRAVRRLYSPADTNCLFTGVLPSIYSNLPI